VNSVFLQDRVELLQFDPLRGVFLVFLRHVTARARHAGIFMFRTLQNDCDAVSFLSHDDKVLEGCLNFFAGGAEFAYNSGQSALVDGAHGLSAQFERDPAVFFSEEEALALQIRHKTTNALLVRKRHLVAFQWRFTGDLTNACH